MMWCSFNGYIHLNMIQREEKLCFNKWITWRWWIIHKQAISRLHLPSFPKQGFHMKRKIIHMQIKLILMAVTRPLLKADVSKLKVTDLPELFRFHLRSWSVYKCDVWIPQPLYCLGSAPVCLCLWRQLPILWGTSLRLQRSHIRQLVSATTRNLPNSRKLHRISSWKLHRYLAYQVF